MAAQELPPGPDADIVVGEVVNDPVTLEQAYRASVAANKALVPGVDDAIVEAGALVARELDHAVENYEGQDRTKSIYLLPHLIGVLKEQGATPAARAALSKLAAAKAETVPAAPVDAVAAMRARHAGRTA